MNANAQEGLEEVTTPEKGCTASPELETGRGLLPSGMGSDAETPVSNGGPAPGATRADGGSFPLDMRDFNRFQKEVVLWP